MSTQDKPLSRKKLGTFYALSAVCAVLGLVVGLGIKIGGCFP